MKINMNNDEYIKKIINYEHELWIRTDNDKKLYYLSILLRLLNYENDRYNFTKACELYPFIIGRLNIHIIQIISQYLSKICTKVNHVLKFTCRCKFQSINHIRNSYPMYIELSLNMNKIAHDSIQFLNKIGIQVDILEDIYVSSNSIINHINDGLMENHRNNAFCKKLEKDNKMAD